MSKNVCDGCDLPRPAEWCWEHRVVDCPAGRPPRHMRPIDLWQQLNDQERRLKELEALTSWMGTLMMAENPDAGWPGTP